MTACRKFAIGASVRLGEFDPEMKVVRRLGRGSVEVSLANADGSVQHMCFREAGLMDATAHPRRQPYLSVGAAS